MTYRPLKHRVVVRQDALTNTTESGIVLQEETAKHRQKNVYWGTVEASQSEFIDVGDRVVFSRFAGEKLDDDLVLLKDDDILAKAVHNDE